VIDEGRHTGTGRHVVLRHRGRLVDDRQSMWTLTACSLQIDDHMTQDAVEPGDDLVVILELVDLRHRLEEALLHGVRCQVRVAGSPAGECDELVEAGDQMRGRVCHAVSGTSPGRAATAGRATPSDERLGPRACSEILPAQPERIADHRDRRQAHRRRRQHRTEQPSGERVEHASGGGDAGEGAYDLSITVDLWAIAALTPLLSSLAS